MKIGELGSVGGIRVGTLGEGGSGSRYAVTALGKKVYSSVSSADESSSLVLDVDLEGVPNQYLGPSGPRGPNLLLSLPGAFRLPSAIVLQNFHLVPSGLPQTEQPTPSFTQPHELVSNFTPGQDWKYSAGRDATESVADVRATYVFPAPTEHDEDDARVWTMAPQPFVGRLKDRLELDGRLAVSMGSKDGWNGAEPSLKWLWGSTSAPHTRM